MSISDKDLHAIYNQGMQHSHMSGLQAVWNYAQNWIHSEANLKMVAAAPPPALVVPPELVAARDKLPPPPSPTAGIMSLAQKAGTPIPVSSTPVEDTRLIDGPDRELMKGDEALFYPNLTSAPGLPVVGPFPAVVDVVHADTVDLTVIRPNKPNVLVSYVPIGPRPKGMYCVITEKL